PRRNRHGRSREHGGMNRELCHSRRHSRAVGKAACLIFRRKVAPQVGFGTANSERSEEVRFPTDNVGSQRLSGAKEMAPQVGFEPTTLRLTAGCSAIELLRNTGNRGRNEPPY